MPLSLLDVLTIAITAAIGIGGIASIFRHAGRRINLSVLFLTFLMLYLGGGASFALLVADSATLTNYMQPYDVVPGDIARACFTTLLFGSALWFITHVLRHPVVVSRSEIVRLAQRAVGQRQFGFVMTAAAGLQLYALSTGTLGFEGVLLDTGASELGMASPWALLGHWLSVALAPSCAFLMAARRKVTLALLLGFLWNLGLVTIVSRRNFLSVAFISTLPLFVFPFRRWLRVMVVASAAVAGVLAVIVFFSFRLSMWEYELQRTELTGIVSGGVGLLRAGGGVGNRLTENMSTRTFNICYTSLIAKNSRWVSGGNGIILGYSAASVVPAFLFPQKPYFSAIGGEEGVTMRVLSIRTNGDENNSIVTAALSDFGYAGLIVYAVILYFIMAVAVKAVRCVRSAALGLVGLCLLLFTLTDIENQFAAIFTSLRLIVTLCVIGGAWMCLVPPKPRRALQ